MSFPLRALLAGLALPLGVETARPDAAPLAEAVHARSAVTLDGRDDELFWAEAPAIDLATLGPRPPRLPGRVRLAWDERHLYVFAELRDDDVVATGGPGPRAHQTEGDVLELFIGPAGRTWYWELHYTPAGRRAAFFFPSAGRRLGSSVADGPRPRHRHAARVDGTINDWRDRDSGWSAEIAIPWAGLAVDDGAPAPRIHEWRLLFGRYAYSRWQEEVEISFWPPLPALRFHRPALFAPLRLLPPTDAPATPDSAPRSSKRSSRNARG